VRDLSGAVIALRKSLDFNKKNTNARNLLGLIYYEMGETVAALSEWVISRHFQQVNNDADDYISRVQSNPTKLDALNQAIKRYNTALGFAKQGSDDLAIIQLKKVVNLNPNFIRAYQLLALLLVKTGDNERARKFLIRAGRIDVSNTATLLYLQELENPAEAQSKDLDANPEAEQSIVNTIMPISSYKEDKPNIIAFVNLVIGVIIGIAVTAFLILPTVKKNNNTHNMANNADISSYVAQLQEKENKISELQSQNDTLTQEVSELQSQIENAPVPEDKSGLYNSLSDAANKYLAELVKPKNDRNLTAVADILAAIDDTKMDPGAQKTLLTSLRSATYPDAAKFYYTKGHDLYRSDKYQEAITELAKAMVFDPADVDAVYFTARAYDQLDDKQKATVYYNKVINDYPDSSRVSNAKSFLTKLQ
jgi:tetratricopeptide (TPR) repeat protein